jgi:peptidyl-prolyl cis-trans isomerase A (cyclophilin A)
MLAMRMTFLLSLCGLSLLAQAPPAAQPAKPPKPVAAKPKPVAAPAVTTAKPGDPREPGLYGVLETSMGSLKFVLYEKAAPVTVRNFVDLALGRKLWFDEKVKTKVKRPLYPGTIFHRVMPAFMIQVGDPTGSGAGDVGFTVPDEIHPDFKYDRPGRFGMANAGPNTNSSQFFITEVPTPWLDGKHTIFGQVTENQDLVNQIARVPRNQSDNRPNTPVTLVRITFERVGPVPANAPEGAAPPMKKAVPAVKQTTTAPATKAPATKAPATKAPATKAPAAPTKK